ncbi:MAG: VOC family protein [Nocardioidaceae bacterium]|nr:VOC family protein [Nocardioidaceae bacterium]
MTTTWTLTFDCASPALLAGFWKLALGYVDAAPPVGFASWEDWLTHFDVPEDEWDDGAALEDPDGVRPKLSSLKVPEGKVAKNRLHVDLQVSGGRHRPHEERLVRITETVERLESAGASVIREDASEGQLDHVVMADPEGNEFCVV